MDFRFFVKRVKQARSTVLRPARRTRAQENPLRFEPLEPRIALNGAPTLDGIAVPSGQLTGKIVYTSAGHGWQWNSTLGRWATDRGDNNEIVEDFGNQDQMTFFADYLLRAGATVVPMRPVGHQLNEVVLDNDSPGVTYAGAWSNSTSSPFYDEDYGAQSDSVSYRFSSVSATETATATYTPNIPEAGYYPVYTWVLDSTNRTNQLYRIHDSGGGVTEIRVDHRKVGKGWVYLGTYHFDQGTSGSVVISNQSTDGGSVVIADAVRFGNGMGDMKDGPGGVGAASGTISGYPREDENSLMWLWRSVGQGASAASVVGTGNVSAPQRMAEYMNNDANAFGDSVYIGFHSNASNGTGRGAVGLIDVNFSDQTPNQPQLALYTGRQINQDMQALNGQYEHNWSTRTTHTFSSNFGEIDGGQSAEMDQTIIEVGFHDSVQDAQLMRDPAVREQLARSTYEAVLEYFDNFGGLSTPISQPSAPVSVAATTSPGGDIAVTWSAGPTGVLGGVPTEYRVYVSRDGHGYLGYVEVPANAPKSFTFAASELDTDAYYFKVVAVNNGGESPASAVTMARRSEVSTSRVLVVDGFDRNDRTLNERYAYAFTGDGLVDRVRTDYNNSFNYVIQYGEAMAGLVTEINTAQNERVIAGDIDLGDYDMVFWYLGEESTVDETFSNTEQTLVGNYLTGGGKLLVSGAEIGWDLVAQGGGASFYNNQLRAAYAGDDANTYNATGVAGSIFAGISLSFDDGDLWYDVTFPDVLAPNGGSTVAMNYVGGSGGPAALQYEQNGVGHVVNVGFPVETIVDAQDRIDVLTRVFEFFDGGPKAQLRGDYDSDNDVDNEDYLVWKSTYGSTTDLRADGNNDLIVNLADHAVWRENLGTSVAAAQAISAPATLAAVTEPAPDEMVSSAEAVLSLVGVDASLSDGLATRRTSTGNQQYMGSRFGNAETPPAQWRISAADRAPFARRPDCRESKDRSAASCAADTHVAMDEAFADILDAPLD